MKFIRIIFLLAMWALFACSARLYAQELDELAGFISQNDSILVANAGGHIVLEKNAAEKRIPASTLKVFSSLVALNYLGEDYRFPTEFYLDKDANLKIKGYGDPLLISEVLARISQVCPAFKQSNFR